MIAIRLLGAVLLLGSVVLGHDKKALNEKYHFALHGDVELSEEMKMQMYVEYGTAFAKPVTFGEGSRYEAFK